MLTSQVQLAKIIGIGIRMEVTVRTLFIALSVLVVCNSTSHAEPPTSMVLPYTTPPFHYDLPDSIAGRFRSDEILLGMSRSEFDAAIMKMGDFESVYDPFSPTQRAEKKWMSWSHEGASIDVRFEGYDESVALSRRSGDYIQDVSGFFLPASSGSKLFAFSSKVRVRGEPIVVKDLLQKFKERFPDGLEGFSETKGFNGVHKDYRWAFSKSGAPLEKGTCEKTLGKVGDSREWLVPPFFGPYGVMLKDTLVKIELSGCENVAYLETLGDGAAFYEINFSMVSASMLRPQVTTDNKDALAAAQKMAKERDEWLRQRTLPAP